MTPRLLAELQRLFLPSGSLARPAAEAAGLTTAWADARGRVRVLALALASEAGWAPLAAVWQGVQAELDLPAPAIAVDGRGALQLWFPLAQPVPMDEALDVLDALRRRFLAELPAHRIGQWPAARRGPGAADAPGELGRPAAAHTGPAIDHLPPRPVDPERWSAFVSPDLAPVFADTPWLEIPPGDDAQASLLSRIQPISAGAWHEARQRLMPAAAPAALAPPAPAPASAAGGLHRPPPAPGLPDAAADAPGVAGDAPGAADDSAAASRFLRAVMDDAAIPLALRIEAAKALLQASAPRR